MKAFWTTGPRRSGTAIIEPFRQDLRLEGILYQTKYEFDAKGNQLPINEKPSNMLKKIMRRNAANFRAQQ
jgi:hypothetical protein